MKAQKNVFVPNDYADELPRLKEKYFSWQVNFTSKTDLGTMGKITYYSVGDDVAYGNFVLVPGLASNTEIEPLMCALSYWAFKHKYNIYAVDTFLGDFKPEISEDLAKKNTFAEFVDLMDVGLDIIAKMSIDKWTCVVGHSLGGTGSLAVFNRRVLNKQPIGFSGGIFFAPYVTKEWCKFSKEFMLTHQYPNLSIEESSKLPMGMMSPHDIALVNASRYVSLPADFYDSLDEFGPRPDLMAQYNIPITLVAGGRDKKAPIEYIRGIYNQVNAYSPMQTMRFVEFPKSKHSFINQHDDCAAILRLIKTQYTRAKRKQK